MENAVFLQAIAYKLSDLFFKNSVKMTEEKQYSKALAYINKSINYFDASEEFSEKFSESYPVIEKSV